MKTSELIGPALDWVVAKCEGFADSVYMPLRKEGVSVVLADGVIYTPRRDWAQGGPIIERETLDIRLSRSGEQKWMSGNGKVFAYGPTPLVAAMRAYVVSKLGDDVDIPAELLG